MINQVTAFLENSEGRLAALCRCLADANIDMSALTIAETSEYGLIRIICKEPERAVEALRAANFHAALTKVVAIAVPDRPGGLADLLECLDELGVNVEYGYCFSKNSTEALDVFKIEGDAKAAEAVFALEAAGFRILKPEDLA